MNFGLSESECEKIHEYCQRGLLDVNAEVRSVFLRGAKKKSVLNGSGYLRLILPKAMLRISKALRLMHELGGCKDMNE